MWGPRLPSNIDFPIGWVADAWRGSRYPGKQDNEAFYYFERGEGRLAARDVNHLLLEWETKCWVKEAEPILITASYGFTAHSP